MLKRYEYDAVLREEDDGGAYVRFPWDLRQEFDRGRMKVHARFDGIPYDGSIVNMGVKNPDGSVCWIIGVRKAIRNALNKKNGDTIHVEIEAGEGTGSEGIRLSADPSGFVLLSQAVPEAIQEIRYYSEHNFVGERIDGYKEPEALLTREAAAALKAACGDALARGYRLKIYDAYRPQRAVTHFLNWARNLSDTRMKAVFYPELEKEELFSRGYIAEHSGHSRGSAVDLTLVELRTGRDVDMGGPFDYFGSLSRPDYPGILPEQRANRMLLREIMLAHGFLPLAEEWWHFTLKNEPCPDTYFTFPVRKLFSAD
jgi:D-alanyl-D-alanine dipeptidase